MVAESRKFFFFGFPGRFLEIFLMLSTPQGLRSNSKENKKTVFIVFFDLKDFGGQKRRREKSPFQVVPFTISTNFGFNLSMKVYARENPYKNGDFLVSFYHQKTIEIRLAGIYNRRLQILNFMSDLDIYFQCLIIPIENWLRGTHNQRQKTLIPDPGSKVA